MKKDTKIILFAFLILIIAIFSFNVNITGSFTKEITSESVRDITGYVAKEISLKGKICSSGSDHVSYRCCDYDWTGCYTYDICNEVTCINNFANDYPLIPPGNIRCTKVSLFGPPMTCNNLIDGDTNTPWAPCFDDDNKDNDWVEIKNINENDITGMYIYKSGTSSLKVKVYVNGVQEGSILDIGAIHLHSFSKKTVNTIKVEIVEGGAGISEIKLIRDVECITNSDCASGKYCDLSTNTCKVQLKITSGLTAQCSISSNSCNLAINGINDRGWHMSLLGFSTYHIGDRFVLPEGVAWIKVSFPETIIGKVVLKLANEKGWGDVEEGTLYFSDNTRMSIVIPYRGSKETVFSTPKKISWVKFELRKTLTNDWFGLNEFEIFKAEVTPVTSEGIERVTGCGDCGVGRINICDQEECYGLGANCVFVDKQLPTPNECFAIDCFNDFKNKQDCIQYNDDVSLDECKGDADTTQGECESDKRCEWLNNKCFPKTKCVWDYEHCCPSGMRWDGINCVETASRDLCYSFWSPTNQVPEKSIKEKIKPYKTVCVNIGSVAYGFWTPVKILY